MRPAKKLTATLAFCCLPMMVWNNRCEEELWTLGESAFILLIPTLGEWPLMGISGQIKPGF